VADPLFLAESPLAAGAPEPGDVVRLDGPEGRHAAAVRRVRVGESVLLADGRGLLVRGRVAELPARDVVDVAVEAVEHEPQGPVRLVVVQALPKGDRGELAVETMTEAGVDEVVPWQAERCVVRVSGERAAKLHARWVGSAREAAKQSRRARVPEVAAVASTAQVIARVAAADLAVLLDADDAVPLAALSLPQSTESTPSANADGVPAEPAAPTVVIVVGPEGGVSPAERAALVAAGAVVARLGRPVLRTSTAGVAALAVLQSAPGGAWR
jgi:16S rRNA (uracil1498-N3)-methyltransferase